ncbi:Putative RNA polymerase ECF-subfamily sigma factor [Kitasatospora sp. MMS16-BH015]|uniref:RNA polymerase sigma factor n=1 Tax=Kitasatospora sp. MMS16-BH015 TaxID=2018025 RepID=UPI000CA3E674|nr:sigma-70 family RNA polymerase sigma factor [Kitasatospora sp. MMS16-BH015]AUG82214.1 Putative RNA polymerase ECF-subfamily sigma factor [Kitasatospora sp. MMS16-BH015]
MTEQNCCTECGATATMAFETAYGLYYRPLVLSVRRRAAAWQLSEQDVDVEALVQDTFEQALRVWGGIEVPRAWLYTVARRRLYRCIPAAALRADGDPADRAGQGIVGWTTIAASVSTEDLVAAREITELIQLMPQKRRQEVAYLRYLEEWSFNEIAEQLGCCPATARVHALNARSHIVVTVNGNDANVVVGSVFDGRRWSCIRSIWRRPAGGSVRARVAALASRTWDAWCGRWRGSRQGRHRAR